MMSMNDTTKICDNIFEAIHQLDPHNIIFNNDIRSGGLSHHPRYTYIDMGDGTIGACTLNHSLLYFRGECNLYDHCYSSLDRIKSEDDKMVCQIRTQDFILLLKRNPEIQAAIEHKEYVDFTALAQHYGFPTKMLDVTNDILIAAYFATHDTNPLSGAFEIKKSGIGRIRWSIEHIRPTGRLGIVGMQPLARPGAQNAFGIYLGEKEDYAESSYSIEFIQDPTANEDFHKVILGGPQMIYPNENVNILVNRIQNSTCVTTQAVTTYCQEYGKQREDVFGILQSKNIYVVDAPIADWCLLQGKVNSVPSFRRNQVLRPAFILG